MYEKYKSFLKSIFWSVMFFVVAGVMYALIPESKPLVRHIVAGWIAFTGLVCLLLFVPADYRDAQERERN